MSLFPFRLSWTRLIFVSWVMLLGSVSSHANPASGQEASWFAGEWEVGPAPVEGFETIAGGESIKSVIRHIEGANIEREIVLKGAIHVMRYEVRSFGGNFPWWGENGGNYVSKKRDENSFLLAPVGHMGKADWNQAWLYTRVSSGDE